MKFGLEAEKFLYNLHYKRPSEGVFRFLDALSDFRGGSEPNRITNEFVLNMVEFGTKPSPQPLEILKEYILQYLMIRKITNREEVGLVPFAALPVDYLPHMTTKYAYYVQNSILSGKKLPGWMMEHQSPLKSAGNCAGVHMHTELQTPPEFLFTTRELVDKFNLGLMMTPMIAFASSPYFFGKHEANSMRGMRYFYQTYKNFPLNGGIPPMMKSSAEVLEFFKRGMDHWMSKGVEIGLNKEELASLIRHKGANWNPVRWNRNWNTIEIRCLESDSLELDCAKFIWVCGAMKRSDLEGENLHCEILDSAHKLDASLINECLEVSGKNVTVLPSHAIADLFERAIKNGTEDELVHQYLTKLSQFAKPSIAPEEEQIFEILEKALANHRTTSKWMLSKTNGKPHLTNEEGSELIVEAIKRQEQVIKNIRPLAPEIFMQLNEILPKI